MAYISKDQAQKYYNIILSIHQLENSLANKVPALKNELEEILAIITSINHFTGTGGQRKWLTDNKIFRNNGKVTKGSIPEDIVSGLIHLFANRNIAEHDKKMDNATYLGIFALTAKAISFFSDAPLPDKIQAVCDGTAAQSANTPQAAKEQTTKVKLKPAPQPNNPPQKKENKSKPVIDAYILSYNYINSPPCTWEQVKQKITNGQITRDYYIAQVDSDDYSKIDSIPELAYCFDNYEKMQKEEKQKAKEKERQKTMKQPPQKENKGDFSNDKRKKKHTYANGDIYEGDLVDGKFHGKGKYIFADGTVYEGDFLIGTFHGKGKITWTDGTVYEGDFFLNKKTGKGKYIFASGTVYEGDFVDGSFHGKGKWTDANGAVYEGDFVDDSFHGKGKYIVPNGEVYEGEVYEGDFVDGAITGKGKWISAEGDVHEGCFVNSWFHGKVKSTYANGDVFEGNWKRGLRPYGKGKYITANGTVYEGYFERNFGKYDNCTGKGKITFPDGTVYEGDFVDGKPTGKGNA